ncbi:MAG: hydrogenase maturation protease [Candidatus Ranarchaeia archaeon]|jgi:hydrogenase maturation protease
MTLLVLGVGNPILGDDGVGIYVARELKKRLLPKPTIEIDEIETGGLDLVERLLDYDQVIIIDSTISGRNPIGTISQLEGSDFTISTRSANVHGLAFPEVLDRLNKAMPQRVPQSIKIFVIEISKEYNFSEKLSDPIMGAAEKVIAEIMNLLKDR